VASACPFCSAVRNTVMRPARSLGRAGFAGVLAGAEATAVALLAGDGAPPGGTDALPPVKYDGLELELGCSGGAGVGGQ
jgi:hypothetical protein